MRYIEKPQAVVIDQIVEGGNPLPPISFGLDEFVQTLINTDPIFNRDGVGIRSATKIEAAVRSSKDTSVLTLEDADHEKLQQVAEKPANGYPLRPARICQPFVDAIAEAKKQAP